MRQENDMIKFKCERCGAAISCPDANVGKHVVCPTCQHKLIVPHKAAPRSSRLLLIAGLAAVLVAVAWVLWAFSGSTPEGPADGTPSADTTTPPTPGTPAATREAERRSEERLDEWQREETARKVRDEIDRAKWMADLKAKQLKEEAELKKPEKDRR